MKYGALALLCMLVSGCAARSTPSPTAPELLLSEQLASNARVCVVLDPFHYQTQYACITVGALRATIRGRALARLEVTRDAD